MKERTIMPERDPVRRSRNFEEVDLGLPEENAVEEAKRCLQCKNPKCVGGCPVNIDIPGFIKLIVEGKFDEAAKHIKKTNSLPGVCGRVCPQETQCQGKCILNVKGCAISIGWLERFASDNEKTNDILKINKKGKKAAVVGSGPAGLTCGGDLAKLGYDVTIFESLHKPGGVLVYGIPEFRLPNSVVENEIEYVKKLGVKIKTNMLIGNVKSINQLKEEFDAVFIGSGAGLPYFMNVPGENLVGVYSANEFLTRNNLMHAYDFPRFITPIRKGKKVVVIGGGNVAMDSARTARRLGAEVAIIYRRTETEMPARNEEIEHAKEEGIKFLLLTCPVKIIGKDKVEDILCVQMMLGEPDESGRRTPIPLEGSEFKVECDQVIVAIGQGPNPLIVKKTNIQHGRNMNLIVDENMMTSIEGVYAGGDIASGASTVIKAMGDGKRAAKAIDKWLSGGVDINGKRD